PKREDMINLPISPYGVSKMTCEAYMQVYHQIYGLKTVSLRYFNVFGPRQKDSPYSGVIAIWLGRLINNKDLIIFGNGEQSRDFTYVKDVVQANILAAECDIKGEILNIGANSPITLTHLAKMFFEITNRNDLNIIYTDPRPGDILHSYGDISKAKKIIKYQPKYTQKEGLEEYFTWYSRKYNIDLKI
ncbi:MAG: NAD-dependent epimerase/dehydratase family protein, partial [Promethearchaeota archaeon]